jgi:hypothetical protein
MSGLVKRSSRIARLAPSCAMLALSLGCGTEPDPVRVPEGATAVFPLPFVEAAAAMRTFTGFPSRERVVIRTDAEWREMWALVTDDDDLHLLPAVDFSEEIVVLAAMAPRSTSGHYIRILDVYADGGDYYIVVEETAPTHICTIPGVTSPVDAVRLARPAGRIYFVERTGNHRCRQ